MTIKIKLKLTLSPEQFAELMPILQRMNVADGRPAIAPPATQSPAPAAPTAPIAPPPPPAGPENAGENTPPPPPPPPAGPENAGENTPPPPPPPPAGPENAGENTPPPPPPPPAGPENAGDDAPGPDVSGILDSDGLPWDGRIHSSSRKMLKKTGAWKPLRGVSPETVAAVTAELRARPATQSPAPAAPAAPVTLTATQSPAPAAQTAPAAPIAPPPPPPPAAPSSPCETFPDLIKRVTVAKITNEALNQALKIENVESLVTLAATPDKIPAVARRLGI